jgi:hypothetical protein
MEWDWFFQSHFFLLHFDDPELASRAEGKQYNAARQLFNDGDK